MYNFKPSKHRTLEIIKNICNRYVDTLFSPTRRGSNVFRDFAFSQYIDAVTMITG